MNLRCSRHRWKLIGGVSLAVTVVAGAAGPGFVQGGITGDNPLAMPAAGECCLRVLSPVMLELTLITTKQPDAGVTGWDFVKAAGALQLPEAAAVAVSVNGGAVDAKPAGFKRRVLYAPLAKRDLRIGNYLYLQLSRPVPESAAVEVRNPDGSLWKPEMKFRTEAGPLRWSPAIHVNQTGYVPAWPKQAIIGYYCGSAGELEVVAREFKLIAVASGAEVFSGRLVPRGDTGFPGSVKPYQRVLEANFSDFRTPGEYRVLAPGLGASYPFFIDDGAAAAFARTYALGLYHQRCGEANALPFTRFVHAACHTAPAEIPTAAFPKTREQLASMSEDAKKNPRHTAPQLKGVEASLYPFVTAGKSTSRAGTTMPVTTANIRSTAPNWCIISCLPRTSSRAPGNSTISESRRAAMAKATCFRLRKSKRISSPRCRMPMADFTFSFIRARGPMKTMCSLTKGIRRSFFQKPPPRRRQPWRRSRRRLRLRASNASFPPQPPSISNARKRVGRFFAHAIAQHGRDGSYQKITHYGDTFMHDDELAWAATEMFLATGDGSIHAELTGTFDPAARRREEVVMGAPLRVLRMRDPQLCFCREKRAGDR